MTQHTLFHTRQKCKMRNVTTSLMWVFVWHGKGQNNENLDLRHVGSSERKPRSSGNLKTTSKLFRFPFHNLNDEVMWRFKSLLTFWSLLIYIQMWKSKQNNIVGSEWTHRLEMTSQQGSVQLFIVTTSPVYKSTLLLSLVIKSTPIW